MSTTTAPPDTSAGSALEPAPEPEPSVVEILRAGLVGVVAPIRDQTTAALLVAAAQANLTLSILASLERAQARAENHTTETEKDSHDRH
jgi:hypothetical protein